MTNILEDIKVVELASVLAGPLAGSFLSELGAEVIKIENKIQEGDVTRQWKLPSEDSRQTVSAYYASANTGKRVIMFDLTQESDYLQLVDLIKNADVIISNYQKKTAEKLKIDFASVEKINPKIIYAQLVAYAYNDPRPGYDLVMQAESGFISMNGAPDGQLAKMPVALIDVIAGHQLKEAILLAMISKMKTGNGSYSEVSLYKSAISGLVNQASNYLNERHIPGPMGTLHPNIAPYGDVVTTNDGFLVILAIGSDKQFEKLGKTLKLDADVVHTFSTNKRRVESRAELLSLLQDKIGKMKYEILSTSLLNANIPFCLIEDLAKVFENPLAKQMIIEEIHDGHKMLKVKNVAFDLWESSK